MTVHKWGVETLVNTNVAGNQAVPTVVGLTGGGYVISWTDLDVAGGDGNSTSTKFQRYDAGGNKLGGEVIANFDAVGVQNNSGLVATDDGGFTVVWIDSGDVEYRRFDANGIALDPGDRLLFLLGNQALARPATLGTGFVMAFESDGTTPDILAQRFLANGDATGSAIAVAATLDSEVDPAVAELAGGGFVVAWEDETTDRIRIRGFNAAGGETIAAVNISSVDAVSGASITPLANGNFVVAWEDDTDSSVRARLVFSGGFGTEFTVNTSTDGSQIAPRLAALPDGGFVAVYQSGDDVRGQVFDAFAARDGNEFVVNTGTFDDQVVPTVSALSDGRFVVTWSDGSSLPDDLVPRAIRQQIFDPRDGVVSGTDIGETLYGHESINDEINGLGGNDTLIGLAGADLMYGGDGSDTYVVDNPGDRAIELVDPSTDLVQSSVSFALGANVENLTLTGVAAINAIGNALANILTGNAAANILTGGLGQDTLAGAGGPDRFDFNAVIESAAGAASRDAIAGFSHAQHDRIDLATIDANQTAGHGGNQVFVFIGSQKFAAHPGSGEVRNGPGGVIQINVDADSAPEMEIGVGHALVAADFIL